MDTLSVPEMIKKERISLSFLFSCIVICFGFPFLDVKCAGTKTTSFSGFELAKGLEINKTFLDLYNKTKIKNPTKPEREIKESDKIKLRVVMWSVVSFAILGGIISFFGRFLLSSLFGFLCALGLLIFWYNIRQITDYGDGALIEVRFAPAFWIALILGITASLLSLYFSFKRSRVLS